jgi:hypothetical protein
MSFHIQRAIEVAQGKGAYAGESVNRKIWDLSKRELVEIALHLAASSTDSYDEALGGAGACERVFAEHKSLKDNGIL